MRRSLLPDMARLQTFEAAARHGNFSRAAEELHLTQSAVSRQIKELEASTGLQLFERIRQRVVLSEAGARLLPEVRHLLTEAERLVIGTLAADPVAQPLRVASLPTFGSRWLVPRLGQFMASHPEVALTLVSRDRPFSFEDEGVDLSIHFGEPVWPGAVTTFLCKEAVVPVASRDLLTRLAAGRLEAGFSDPERADPGQADPRRADPERAEFSGVDLGAVPLLHLTTRPRLWSQWFDHSGQSGAEAYRGTRFDQFSMIISAVLSGLGVGLLPTYLIERETESGEIVPLAEAAMETENGYYIVVPEGRQAHPSVRAFQDWLLRQVDRGMPTGR